MWTTPRPYAGPHRHRDSGGKDMVDVMLNEYETICPECKGSGAVEHPAWPAFNLQYPNWWNMKPKPESPHTPMEKDCCTCDGSGIILTPKGDALIDFIIRHITVWYSEQRCYHLCRKFERRNHNV